MKRNPPKASGAMAAVMAPLLLLACGQTEETRVQPSSDRLVARSVADVAAANAALAAPYEPSKSIAEIARPAPAAKATTPARSVARPVEPADAG